MSNINADLVLKVKAYSDNYKNLSSYEIGLLVSQPYEVVDRIICGDYDHLLNEDSEINDSTTVIPYDTLKRLIACEYAVEAILKISKLSEVNDSNLFFPSNSVYGLLRAYLPEEVNERILELKEQEEDNID